MLFQLIVMALAMAGGCWLTYLCAKHGGGWVLGQFKARGLAAEAALKAKAIDVAGPLEARLAALEKELVDGVHARLAAIEAALPGLADQILKSPAIAHFDQEIAALKAKQPAA